MESRRHFHFVLQQHALETVAIIRPHHALAAAVTFSYRLCRGLISVKYCLTARQKQRDPPKILEKNELERDTCRRSQLGAFQSITKFHQNRDIPIYSITTDIRPTNLGRDRLRKITRV